MADVIFNMYFEHYYHLDIIDNGLYDCYDLKYVERAQADVERIHAQLDFVPGSNILLKNWYLENGMNSFSLFSQILQSLIGNFLIAEKE